MPSHDNVAADAPILALERRIPELMAQANAVGLSVAWVQNAADKNHPGVAWQRGFGVRDRGTGEPVTPDTVFQAASLSKPVFAYAVLKACAEGLLDLDTPLSTCLPEPYISDDPRLHRITARHVLSHTPGFPNWRPKDQPLRIHFAPGERFAYSGEGYVYLQRVIEHLSGQPLDEWMWTRLLGPLGMRRSSYVWADAYETQAARGHDGEGKPKEPRKMLEPNAAYSLYTTPSELARFMALLLEPPGDPACLTADQVAHMLSPQIPVNDAGLDAERPSSEVHIDERVSWGLGWGVQHAPNGKAFWHWGDNGDFQAFAMGLPRQKAGMVCMANSESGRALWADLFAVAFGGAQLAIAWLMSLYGANKPNSDQDASAYHPGK
jgi:CubicO group peptidase (beta-lactamase class C family)